MKRLLIFHKAIAPYRIDFFNSLNETYEMRLCPFSNHMISQPFNHEKLARFFHFEPCYLKEKWNLGFVKVPKGIIHQIKAFIPDVVFVNEFSMASILVILYKRIFRKAFKIVSICDDSYNMIVDNNDFNWKHRLAREIITPLLDDLILIDPLVVEWYQSNFNKGIFFPIIRKDDVARKAYSSVIPQTEAVVNQFELNRFNVFLFVGRLVKLKNVITIIKAFLMLDQTKNVLVIVGDGPEREMLEGYSIEKNAHVIFAGRKEGNDLNVYYNIADCCILASYQEAFGAVVNEALLAGCWCLVSSRAGSRCLIEEGKNGFTFDPMDIKELGSKMKESVNYFICKHDALRENRMRYDYQDLFDQLTYKLNSLS